MSNQDSPFPSPAIKIGSDQFQPLDDRFRLLMESVRDYGIFVLSPTGHIETWNEGARRIKGYERSEIIGKHFSIFYTDEDLATEKPRRELEIATSTGRYEEEGWRVRKDGSTFWANIIITQLKDATGKTVGFAKITRDLTERKFAEEALKQSEERFRLIVESVRDYAIIMLNPAGEITSWNEGARRLNGYEANEILGKHFSIFYEPDDVAVGKCAYEITETTATGRFEDEGWRVRKDGTKFWANVVVTALRDATGILRGFSKVTRDVTERKRAEDKLRMAHEQLEKRVEERTKALREAVAARDEFLSIAAHELRTPLTNLKLQYQLLARQIQKTSAATIPVETAKEVSEMTGRQVARLIRLVDDMLDTSRIGQGTLSLELESCDFAELVKAIYATFQPTFNEERINASLSVEDGIIIECDSLRIEQVLSNLISNAVKYGGHSPIEIVLKREGGNAKLSVQDKGPGIKSADRARIFERFERAVSSNDVSGLGLGLFISRQIIELHAGTITVESSGHGTTFNILLPLAAK